MYILKIKTMNLITEEEYEIIKDLLPARKLRGKTLLYKKQILLTRERP
jgi:hypothetical protein